MRAIACIPKHDLVALCTIEGVSIYSYGTKGEPLCVFDKHENYVCGIVHLSDDVLGSVDVSGVLLTWRARTCEVLNKLQVSRDFHTAITKVTPTKLLLGTENGDVIIVGHRNGSNLAVQNRFKHRNWGWIDGISACKDICAFVGVGNTQIWNHSTGDIVHHFQDNGESICAVAISENLVLRGGCDGFINVYEIGDNKLEHIDTIDLLESYHSSHESFYICDISFLSVDIVMVVTAAVGIFFVSVQSGSCISHLKLKDSGSFQCAAVLSDGRVCVGGCDGPGGYCVIFQPPPEVAD